MEIDEMLDKIDEYAVFVVLDDVDEVLVSIGGGEGIPIVAAWDKNGFRAYDLDDRDRYPLERDEFIEMVKAKEPI